MWSRRKSETSRVTLNRAGVSAGLFFRFLVAALGVTLLWTASAGAQTTVAIDGVECVALPEVARTVGLGSGWTEPGKQFALSGQNARLEFRMGSRELRLNGMRLFLGEPTLLHRRQLHVTRTDYEKTLLPLLLPQARTPSGQVRTILIDPGHGGRDSGTRNPQLNLHEKNLALNISKRLGAVLEQQGYRVFLTRTDDTFLPLEDRAALAGAVGADLFISIHFNAVGNPTVHGTETYVLTPRTQRSTGQAAAAAGDVALNRGNDHDHWNILLGYLVHRQLLRDLNTFDRGLKRARFQVLRGADCPAVLVEAGYLSNQNEAARITTADYQNDLVRSLAIAVNRYRQATENIAAARN